MLMSSSEHRRLNLTLKRCLRLSLAISLMSQLVVGCAERRSPDPATLHLTLSVEPPLSGALPLLTRAERAEAPLLSRADHAEELAGGAQGGAQGGVGGSLWSPYPPQQQLSAWSAEAELSAADASSVDDPAPPAVQRGKASGLFTSPSSAAVSASQLNISGASAPWLSERAGEGLERVRAQQLSYQLPLRGLDYRSSEVALSSHRAIELTLSPWSLLLAARGAQSAQTLALERELRPSLAPLSGARASALWGRLAPHLSLSEPWSVGALLAALSYTETTEGSSEELKALEAELTWALTLAVAASLDAPLEGAPRESEPGGEQGREQGGEQGGEQAPALQEGPALARLVPCLIAQLMEGELSAAQLSLSAPCVAPERWLWLDVPGPQPSPLSAEGERLELHAGRLDGAPVQRALYQLPSALSPSLADTLTPALFGERLERLLALAERELEVSEGGASLSLALLKEDQPLLLATAAPLELEEGAPEEMTKVGRLMRWRAEALPSWSLALSALGETDLALSVVSAPWRTPLSERVSLDERGQAQLELTGVSPLAYVSGVIEGERWSPFPAPGRWRAPYADERLSALITSRDTPALSLERPQETLLELGALLPLSPLSTLISALAPDHLRRGEPLDASALDRLSALRGLESELLRLFSPPSSPVSERELPSLAAQLETLASLNTSEGRASLYTLTRGVEPAPLSDELIAHLRAWRCLEAATLLGAQPPLSAQLVTEDTPQREVSGELSEAWRAWVSAGCLLSELAWQRAEVGDALTLEPQQEREGALSVLERALVEPTTFAPWLSQLINAQEVSLESPERALTSPLRAALRSSTSDELQWLELEGDTLTLPHDTLDRERLLLTFSAPFGVTSFKLTFEESPWRARELDEALRARGALELTRDAPLEGAARASCVWREASLGALSGRWTQAPLEALSLEGAQELSWSFERALSPSQYEVSPPCALTLSIPASELKSGAYKLKLSASQPGLGEQVSVVRFQVSHEPPPPTLTALSPFELSAQRAQEGVLRAHLISRAPLSELSDELSGSRELLSVEFERAVRCDLVEPQAPEALSPLLSASFSATEALSGEELVSLEPDEGGWSARWTLSARAQHEGSTRYALRCVDPHERGEQLTIDVTLDPTPPRLLMAWLTQTQEGALNARRLVTDELSGEGEGGELAQPHAWLLWSDPELELPLELFLPPFTDLRAAQQEGERFRVEEELQRWLGWWGAPHCERGARAPECLLGLDEPCDEQMSAACLEREGALTLWVLSEEESWQPEALTTTLNARLRQGAEVIGEAQQLNASPRLSERPAEALFEGVGLSPSALFVRGLELKELWREGGWPSPSALQSALLSGLITQESPAWRSEGLAVRASLRSLTPPLELQWESEPSWWVSEAGDELRWFSQTRLATLELINPHPHPVWFKLTSPSPFELTSKLTLRHESVELPAEALSFARLGCLWDSEEGRADLGVLLTAQQATPLSVLSSSEGCSLLTLARDELFQSAATPRASLSALEPLEEVAGWARLEVGERVSARLEVAWAHPSKVQACLFRLFELPPSLEGAYAYPFVYQGFYWRVREESSPSLLYGRPYQLLSELSLPSLGGEGEWSLEQRAAHELTPTEAQRSERVWPLLSLPSPTLYSAP